MEDTEQRGPVTGLLTDCRAGMEHGGVLRSTYMLMIMCFKYIYLRVIAPTSEKSEIVSWTFQIKRNVSERPDLAMLFTNRHAFLHSSWWPGEATAPPKLSHSFTGKKSSLKSGSNKKDSSVPSPDAR